MTRIPWLSNALSLQKQTIQQFNQGLTTAGREAEREQEVQSILATANFCKVHKKVREVTIIPT